MTDIVTGQIVRVRSRQYLVEEVVSKPSPEQDTKVSRLPLLFESPGADDERAEFSEEEVIAEEDAQMAVVCKLRDKQPVN